MCGKHFTSAISTPTRTNVMVRAHASFAKTRVVMIMLMACILLSAGVVSGSSVVLMGAGTSDETEGRDPHDSTSEAVGIRLTLRQGDVIIHPAGTSHANLSIEGEYRYLAFFPRVG
ncbi:hypothetical protein AUP68_02235 [Ilyonectria robusta]